MSESSVGYVKNDQQQAINMFVPILNNGAYYLVATENSKLCGWILIGQEYSPFTNEWVGLIYDLSVFKDYRKKGVGKKLIRNGLTQLKKSGYQKVQLNVFSGNPAKSLYNRLGFQEISTLMEKSLKQLKVERGTIKDDLFL